jgi:hypothetical protein
VNGFRSICVSPPTTRQDDTHTQSYYHFCGSAKSEMKLVTQIVASTYPVGYPSTYAPSVKKLDIWHLWFLEVSKLASRISCLYHLFIIWWKNLPCSLKLVNYRIIFFSHNKSASADLSAAKTIRQSYIAMLVMGNLFLPTNGHEAMHISLTKERHCTICNLPAISLSMSFQAFSAITYGETMWQSLIFTYSGLVEYGFQHRCSNPYT